MLCLVRVRKLHVAVLATLVSFPVLAADSANSNQSDAKTYEQVATKAIDYLRTKGQSSDGSYNAQTGIGVTAIVATAILHNGGSPDDPAVAKSLKYLSGFIHPDGGINVEGSRHRNYETCLALQCFVAANRDKRYDKVVKDADKFLRGLQWTDQDGTDRSKLNFGGAGYGGTKSRPDLSNTGFLIDALKAAGAGPEDEAVQRALVFVSRCQNLETENNTTPFAAKIGDGGFYYTAAAGGSSMAGTTENGGLRSYGSMSYVGLKSMIFAGVGPDDPRVKAAVEWARKHYGVTENPGMGKAGLYYYYHTFAKALAALGEDEFKDGEGKAHNWRSELLAELARRQRSDGSWINENPRWMEGDSNLVTGYALLTLAYCKPSK